MPLSQTVIGRKRTHLLPLTRFGNRSRHSPSLMSEEHLMERFSFPECDFNPSVAASHLRGPRKFFESAALGSILPSAIPLWVRSPPCRWGIRVWLPDRADVISVLVMDRYRSWAILDQVSAWLPVMLGEITHFSAETIRVRQFEYVTP